MFPTARARPLPPPLARRIASASVLLLCVMVMTPWLVVNALLSGAVLGALALGRGPDALAQAIDYAGEIALGR